MQMVPSQFAAVHNKQTTIQLGNNASRYSFVYVGNVAKAHILAVIALLNPSCAGGKVDGELSFSQTANLCIPGT